MKRPFHYRRLGLAIIAMLVFSLSFSACDPLRKKFTRQKKKGQMEDTGFIPVLEPQDYPAPEFNPPQMYRQHYDIIKAWYKDLWTAIPSRSVSDKQTRYVLKQIYDHLDQMQPLLNAEKQAEFAQLKGLLKYYDDALNSPYPLRNISRIQSDLRAFDRALRKLNPGAVQGSMAAAPAQ